jgi:hypothetical protein
MLDTGAFSSYINEDTARISGVGPNNYTSGTSRNIQGGLTGATFSVRTATINQFSIGSEIIRPSEIQVSGGVRVDVLLGFDFFLSHKILIDRAEGHLYLAPNSHPVFRVFH